MSLSAPASTWSSARSGEDHVPAGSATDEITALSGRDRIGAAIAHGDVFSRKGDDVVVPSVPISTSARGVQILSSTCRRRGFVIITIAFDLRAFTTRDVRDAVVPIGQGGHPLVTVWT